MVKAETVVQKCKARVKARRTVVARGIIEMIALTTALHPFRRKVAVPVVKEEMVASAVKAKTVASVVMAETAVRVVMAETVVISPEAEKMRVAITGRIAERKKRTRTEVGTSP